MAPKGIQRIDPTKSFAEIFGLAEPGKTPVTHIVRILAMGKKTGKVVAVFEWQEIRDGKPCGRPPGWAMPGGIVEPNESPQEFIKRRERRQYGGQEYGEIPWEIDEGSILYLATKERDRNTRLEHIHFFFVLVDEEKPTAITERERKEVSTGELFEIRDVFEAPLVDTSKDVFFTEDQAKDEAKKGKFYSSHSKGYYAIAWRKYQEMVASGEIPAVPAPPEIAEPEP